MRQWECCDTFTVTDAFSRFVLYCQAIDNLGHEEVDRICDALMKKYGVPERIRADNGTPFSSISGVGYQQTFREVDAAGHCSREDRAWEADFRTAGMNGCIEL